MKILMLIDLLDIGGAETHVETLACELSRFGHEVVVVSHGGMIAEKMKTSGTKHLLLPDIIRKKSLCGENKAPLPVRFSTARELMDRYISSERPDIVHAHTRRMALLASDVCKKYNLPLVTTAHAMFSMNFPKNILSQWGDGTIAVGEDIKNHLTAHAQVVPEDVCVIENGVKIPKQDEICCVENSNSRNREADYQKNPRKVVFVSRLDADCSIGAHFLCEIAPQLAEKYSDLQIIIVGGGTEYPEILQKAQKINSKINRELIIAVGSSKNPATYFQEGALFVGVSRASLEAMAHKMAVILFGNEGYLGLVSKENLSFAKMSNFTCRGALLTPSKSEFFKEICKYFDLQKDEREDVCAFLHEVVRETYSAERMAQKTLDFYQNTIKKVENECGAPTFPSKKIVLCGYYGNGNFGDEAILSILKEKIAMISPEAKNVILLGKNFIKNAKIMKNADLFVFGGGSLLQNSTSDASLFYYLSIISLANALCKRTVMLSNGIGPINDGKIPRRKWLKMIGGALKPFDMLSVRDSASRKLLSELLPSKKIHLIHDPAIINVQKINRQLILLRNEEELKHEKEEFFVFNPCARGLYRCDEMNLDYLADSLLQIEEKTGARAKILVLNEIEDFEIALELSKGMSKAEVAVPKNEMELVEELSSARFGIFQRYHGALFSALCEVPTVAISDDPKMHSLCEDIIGGKSHEVKILMNSTQMCGIIEETTKTFCVNRAIIKSKIEENAALSSHNIDAILSYFL